MNRLVTPLFAVLLSVPALMARAASDAPAQPTVKYSITDANGTREVVLVGDDANNAAIPVGAKVTSVTGASVRLNVGGKTITVNPGTVFTVKPNNQITVHAGTIQNTVGAQSLNAGETGTVIVGLITSLGQNIVGFIQITFNAADVQQNFNTNPPCNSSCSGS